ncbi:class I SAM-dependent methyltransferase [Woeseiaceae bacterium]|nr:class I SAM-dependent methyltransferase [Woeseiaceae bacterium]MDB2544396.1 class I SAM-dependent methyltransferase [Woeseiaceae bacterium]
MRLIEKPEAPPTQRNKWPILEILSKELISTANILEIGSGTGQHAIFFAEKLPLITWLTSDIKSNHAGIKMWLETYHGSNIRPPFDLEMGLNDRDFNTNIDHVFSSNTSHIMSYKSVKCMFSMIGRLLPLGGKFYLYGPFNINNQFTSKSNQEFDSMLKKQNTLMGIRDIEKLDILAEKEGMKRYGFYEMPSNNYLSIWRKGKFI